MLVGCLFYYMTKIDIKEEAFVDPVENMELTKFQLIASNKMQALADGKTIPHSSGEHK